MFVMMIFISVLELCTGLTDLVDNSVFADDSACVCNVHNNNDNDSKMNSLLVLVLLQRYIFYLPYILLYSSTLLKHENVLHLTNCSTSKANL